MPSYHELPLRIKKEITAQQYNSELLVGSVQFGVVVLLSIINFFTPTNYIPGAPVHSASLGLELFTVLILLRLWFAYTHQLTRWLLSIFVIIEMLLLLFIIWTYYLQFETTATINLKNTHIYYVFVLIALRALRFEPIWVFISGITAAVGWSAIVWQTLSSAGMNVITWDYVTYASTRSLYFGAVFDIIFTILLVTGIISLVLKRAQETLYQAVGQTAAARDLSRFFDSGVAEKIMHSELRLKAGYGDKRQAAIMFTDLRNFTRISEKLEPGSIMTLLVEYQRLLVPIIQKHHGAIDKFIGDGIMASFGAVASSDSYAADALRAVDDIMIAVAKWNERRTNHGDFFVSVGVGLAVGEVIFGVIGNEERLEYTIIGETANLAAKLEKHNKVELTAALSTPETLAKAIQQNYMNPQERETRVARTVAGLEKPINLVVLFPLPDMGKLEKNQAIKDN